MKMGVQGNAQYFMIRNMHNARVVYVLTPIIEVGKLPIMLLGLSN